MFLSLSEKLGTYPAQIKHESDPKSWADLQLWTLQQMQIRPKNSKVIVFLWQENKGASNDHELPKFLYR